MKGEGKKEGNKGRKEGEQNNNVKCPSQYNLDSIVRSKLLTLKKLGGTLGQDKSPC